MAIRADLWNRPLACEELPAMTIEAGCMFRKFSYIRKRGVALSNFLPVFSGKLVA
jgi:hypothetical protein